MVFSQQEDNYKNNNLSKHVGNYNKQVFLISSALIINYHLLIVNDSFVRIIDKFNKW